MTSSASAANPGVQRRVFMLIQAAKALVGTALGLGFFGMVGRPDALELVAMAGLLLPGALALLGFSSIRLALLEQAGLGCFALLIGYLALLTGGVTSPLVVWFALVPAEAALVGGRRAVMRAGIVAGLALLAIAAVQGLGLLPASRLTLPAWEIYLCSVLAALVQAVLIAAAAQDRQRAGQKQPGHGDQLQRVGSAHHAEKTQAKCGAHQGLGRLDQHERPTLRAGFAPHRQAGTANRHQEYPCQNTHIRMGAVSSAKLNEI